MKFDSNRAWQESVAAVRANREVLFTVAGVFFFLPSLLSGVFLTGIETQIYANFQNKAVLDGLIAQHMGLLLGAGLGSMVLQLIGYFATTRLIADRSRPTVGAVLASALRALPTLVAAMIAIIFAMMFVLVLPGAFLASGGGNAGGAAGGALSLLGIVIMIFVCVKASLLVPVVVNEGVLNPMRAIARSWRLTRGHSLRLFGFYVLLAIAYLVLAMVMDIVLVSPVLLLAGQGPLPVLWASLISGLFNASAAVIVASVLVAIHRQFAGDDGAGITRPFE